MRVKYMPVLGKFDVTPTSTTLSGRNPDRDVLGRAIAVAIPLAAATGAPYSEEAKRLIEAAKAIVEWIDGYGKADKKSPTPKPTA